MFVSREVDYALRILRKLSPSHRTSSKDLFYSEQIPQQFAYKILGKLSKADLIRSVRGPDGGTVLIKDLNDISLYDLMEIFDDTLSLARCSDGGYRCEWQKEHAEGCIAHHHLLEIHRKFCDELKRISLQEILFSNLPIYGHEAEKKA